MLAEAGMNKISNFLWKMFCTFMVFSYHNSANSAVNPAKLVNGIYEICPNNYYISKCGDYYVGTNWLHGFGFVENNERRHTGVYYDNSSDANITNNTNLRKMFYGNEAIEYTDSNNDFQIKPFSDYQEDRYRIFSTYCNPQNVNIECKPCPGSGTARRSTVRLNTDMQLASDPEWNMKSIFNCSIYSFSDNTGNYRYFVTDSNGEITSVTAPCYYESTSLGSRLKDRYYYNT